MVSPLAWGVQRLRIEARGFTIPEQLFDRSPAVSEITPRTTVYKNGTSACDTLCARQSHRASPRIALGRPRLAIGQGGCSATPCPRREPTWHTRYGRRQTLREPVNGKLCVLSIVDRIGVGKIGKRAQVEVTRRKPWGWLKRSTGSPRRTSRRPGRPLVTNARTRQGYPICRAIRGISATRSNPP